MQSSPLPQDVKIFAEKALAYTIFLVSWKAATDLLQISCKREKVAKDLLQLHQL